MGKYHREAQRAQRDILAGWEMARTEGTETRSIGCGKISHRGTEGTEGLAVASWNFFADGKLTQRARRNFLRGDDVGKRGKYFLKFRIICIPLQRKWFFNCFRDINKAFKALYLGNQESRKFSLLRQDKVAIDVFGM